MVAMAMEIDAPREASVQDSARSRYYGPGMIYGSTLTLTAIIGGRYSAPFLEHEAGMDPQTIGYCMAVQVVVAIISFAVGSLWADSRERIYPHGRGRSHVMYMGILISIVSFLLQGAWHVLPTVDLLSSVPYHFGLRIFFATSVGLISPILDGMTMDYLKKHPTKTVEDYGKERLHGAIWWAIANMTLSPLLDRFGFVITYPLGVVAAVAAVITIRLFVRGQVEYAERTEMGTDTGVRQSPRYEKKLSDIDTVEEATESSDSTDLEDEVLEKNDNDLLVSLILRLLCGTLYGAIFFLFLFCMSAGQAVVDSLIFLFFEDLGSSYTLMGATVVCTVLFEIPIFHVAPKLLKRFGSGVLFLVAGCCYMVRVTGYSFVPQGHVAYVLLLEPLHGVTYACAQTAAVDTAERSMPRAGYEATAQGVVAAVQGLGVMAGVALGGWTVNHYGARTMYRLSALIVLIGTILLSVAYLTVGPRSQQESLSSIRAVKVPQEDPDDVGLDMPDSDEEQSMGEESADVELSPEDDQFTIT